MIPVLESETCRKTRCEMPYFCQMLRIMPNRATMEGCLVADMVVSAMDDKYTARFDFEADRLPPPLQPLEKSLAVFANSTMSNNFESEDIEQIVGWRMEKGGKGGMKRWWHANEVGAKMSFATPPCNSVSLEIYKHHEIPMGMIEVRVDGNATQIDACCPSPCVGFPGQGIYASQVVGEGLLLVPHHVEITLLERNYSTQCASLGNQFSLVGVFGERTCKVQHGISICNYRCPQGSLKGCRPEDGI
ncbi:unnamed protein product [Polarella glacialis]|uniref:Uncharacterized protein n=1 Tax=Polarella glacialis TaxID=89957 RepID=A0A813DP44_POLGL|nr:unnamed protein product [Polarella glacialis]CAE8734897.1 unnamed protein product [Polarella glacialis]